MSRVLVVLVAGLMGASLMAACSPVQQQSSVSTPVGRPITAGVGDVMLRAEGRESMPNAFGNADLFGRTRPTGLTTIQYGGLNAGRAVLLRSGVATQSTATSMNSTPTVVSSRNSTVVIPASGGQVSTSQLPTIPIEVDWRANPRVPVAGQTIVIEQADATSVTFRVE